MWIKPAIVILLVLLLISLGSGFVFLMRDQGHTRRTLNSLGLRVVIAVALIAVIAWGVYTGQLHSKAPWDARLRAKEQAQQAPASPKP